MLPRDEWMATLARADGASLEALVADAPPLPPHRLLRGPEVGLVMLRGRAGGDGAAFNLGQATLTRCSVALEDGTIGHAWRLGRDRRAAELSALLDALLQHPAWHEALARAVIAPLAAAQRAAAEREARRAAATAVRFATLSAMR